jgi:hypothetical protein
MKTNPASQGKTKWYDYGTFKILKWFVDLRSNLLPQAYQFTFSDSRFMPESLIASKINLRTFSKWFRNVERIENDDFRTSLMQDNIWFFRSNVV